MDSDLKGNFYDEFNQETNDYSFKIKIYSFIFIYYFEIILSIFCNCFIIYVIKKTPKLNAMSTFHLLTNMCIANILNCASVILGSFSCHINFFEIERADSFRPFCILLPIIHISCFYASTYSVLFIAIVSYLQFKNVNSKKYFKYANPASWLIGKWKIGFLKLIF